MPPQPGATIVLKTGPMAGMSGVIKAVEEGRLLVEVDIFGRKTVVAVPPSGGEVQANAAEAFATLVAERTTAAREAWSLAWWAHEAPADPVAAGAAFAEAARAWDAAAREAAMALERWRQQETPSRDAVAAELRRRLPAPLLTPAEQAALDAGRVTRGGAPRLTDAEFEELRDVRQRARARMWDSRVAVATAALPADPDRARRQDAAQAHVDAHRSAWRARVAAGLGLTLPDHAFAHHAFWLGLSDDERAVLRNACGLAPGLLTDWLGPRAPQALPGRDLRQHGRFTRTPPGLLHALWGDSDGEHWGIWFDADAPTGSPLTGGFHGRGGTEIALGVGTLLQVVLERIAWTEPELRQDTHLEPAERDRRLAHLERIVTWLRVLQPGALGHRPEPPGRIRTVDGAGVPAAQVPGGLPAGIPDSWRRREALLSGDAPTTAWIELAEDALHNGNPGVALVIGRDLHWFWDATRPARQEQAARLLAAAHDALGNPALAAIARAHARARFADSISALGPG